MHLLSNIQFTLNNIFELYKTQGKRYYNFSMVFTIFSMLFCTLFTALLLVAYHLIDTATSGAAFDFTSIVEHTNLTTDIPLYMQFMATLTIGLFGILLHAQLTTNEKITFSSFFRSIPADTWMRYFLFTVAGILFSKFATLLLSYDYSYPHSSATQLTQLLDTYGNTGSPLLDWLFSVIRLVLSFLPVILAYFLVRSYLSRRGTVLGKKQARTAFFALLLVGFCINALAMKVVFFVGEYVFTLLYMPFEEWLIPSILGMVVYVFLIAVFYPGLAGSALYPFLYSSDKELVDGTPIDEAP